MLLTTSFWSLCLSALLLLPRPSCALLPPTLPAHPRILLTDARVAELQGQLATNADLQLGYSYLERYVDYLMPLPALKCKPFEPDRSSLAYPMLTRILSLGAVYRLTSNASVGRRAVSELLNLTTDPAWGWGTDPHEEGWIMHAYAPLSSGAMMLAASLGVDWLYPLLTPGELAAVVNSTLVMGLAPFACCFSASDPPGPPPLFPPCLYLDWCGFPAFHNNWSPVLASMSILGGVALAGEEGVPTPWVDATLVSGGVATFPRGLAEFAGDGLYAESVEYGGYVHQFLVPVLAALPYVAPQNASSDVYAALPGACLPLVHWSTLGSFSHATGLGYNWCDADPASDTSQMLDAAVAYFAERAGSPGAAYFARRLALASLPASLARSVSGRDDSRENLVNFLLFFSPSGTLQDYAGTPRDLAFLSKQAFAVRGGEAFGGGEGDTFFAAKGLDGQDQRGPSDRDCQAMDHNHMDAGSFVWDMGGGRFAADLGYENYGVLGYFDPAHRYTYYRASTAGHNTLQIDGLGQAPCTWANFSAINSTDGLALGRGGGCGQDTMADPPSATSTTTAQFWAVLNLTDVYAPAFNASGGGGGGGGGGGHNSPPPPPVIQRGFLALDERSTFATVDEFPSGLARHNITWTLHINGSAVLGSSGHTVTLTTATTTGAAGTTSQAALAINTHPSATDAGCLAGGAFAVHPLVLSPVPGGPGRQQLNTTGITVVRFVIDPASAGTGSGSGSGSGSQCGRLTVVMGGVGILETPPAFPVRPLAQWGGSGPLGASAVAVAVAVAAPALLAAAATVPVPVAGVVVKPAAPASIPAPAPAVSTPLSPAAAPHTVTYDSRSFLLDGERTLLLSGSIHYQRLFVSDWPRALSLAVENGLNTIQTYVTWDEHEPQQGAISFSGKNNLTAFTALAASLGLKVVVRIGPYICGEHFNGGIPLWMRSPPSSAQCFRCSDPAWLNFSQHVLGAVVGELKGASQLWTQGGPVIALQVENEYGGGDVGYLKAVVAQARALTTEVPWILCHDLALCSQVNAGAAGEGGNALCTINGFWEDDSAEGVQQPSPAFMAGQRKNNPGQPLSWTEDQGWFDQWGAAQRIRRPSDILYGVSRAVAYGLSHHNFYMFTGGNNYGFSAANGVTTAYAPDTAVDNLLLRHQPKFSTFAAFHATLASVADALLGAPPPPPMPLGKNCEVVAYGAVTLVSNMGTTSNATEVVMVGGAPLLMPNHTVVILRGSQVLFNTSAAPDFAPAPAPAPAAATTTTASSPPAWVTLVEKLGYGNRSATPAPGAPPLEQLGLTQNLVDYMYFTLTLPTPLNESTVTVNTCGGEYVYLFEGGGAPGAPGAATATATATATPSRTSHTFVLPPRAATGATTTTLSILVSAMGLSTSPSPGSCKGVTRVTAGGSKGRDLTHLGWVSHWVFEGEAERVYTPQGAAAAAWAPIPPAGGTSPTAWFKALMDAPPAPPTTTTNKTAPPFPNLAYALDLNGATKGVVWFNGVNLGRYNLELGVCTGDCAPPHHGTTCYIFWRNCGLPTQRYYHVPEALVQATGNLVVLFEETATVPVAGQGPAQPSPPPPAPHHHRAPLAPPPGGVPRDLSRVALVALTEHP